MDFRSLPSTARELKPTEEILDKIYAAARVGLKGDKLALAAGLLPLEFRRLMEMNPIVEIVAIKGAADGEMAVSEGLHKAASEGDSKAALEILKHIHGWTARTEVTMNVNNKISILKVLEDIDQRVIDGTVREVLPQAAPIQIAAQDTSNITDILDISNLAENIPMPARRRRQE